MINLKQATGLPDPHVLLPNAADNLTNELKTIELVAEPEPGAKTALVRVGAAVTTEEFRRWQIQAGKWTLPMDVVLGESVASLSILTFRSFQLKVGLE